MHFNSLLLKNDFALYEHSVLLHYFFCCSSSSSEKRRLLNFFKLQRKTHSSLVSEYECMCLVSCLLYIKFSCLHVTKYVLFFPFYISRTTQNGVPCHTILPPSTFVHTYWNHWTCSSSSSYNLQFFSARYVTLHSFLDPNPAIHPFFFFLCHHGKKLFLYTQESG